MKKINILLAVILSFACFSCDMDKKPYGQLDEDNAIQTLKDCRSFRNGLYVTFRGLTTGEYVVYGDIQTDNYHAVIGNGGMLSALYSGNLQPELEVFETVWAGHYTTIGSANFIINKMEKLPDADKFDNKEKAELERYLGEALFTRAYCFYKLADYFCGAYDKDNISKPNSGLPLTTVYEPTSNNDKYPGRSTLEDTYKLIVSDLEAALEHLLVYEASDKNAAPASMSPYITSDVVKALQARVALIMGNYDVAISKAEELITSRRYSLIGTAQNYYTFWQRDNGSEAIWMVSMTNLHLGFSTGRFFLANTGNSPFIPTKDVVELFDKEKDIRFEAYFGNRTISLAEGSAEISALTKYPGNPTLFTSSNNYVNMSKPFRISEMYLIVAEASAARGYTSKANQFLNNLKTKRIMGYVPQNNTGENLLGKIQEERQRELLGEGFRLSDLKRWSLGFARSEGQNNVVINKIGDVHRLTYEAGDYRFVWPIPKAELDANPQIKNHQNPGY